MPTRKYAIAENNVRRAFSPGSSFTHPYNGLSYEILGVGKPSATSGGGEPKTDVFVRSRCTADNSIFDLKITYKGSSAEFVENKIPLQRVPNVLGSDWASIVAQAASALDLGSRNLTTYITGTTTPKAYSLGVRLDIMSYSAGSYAEVVLSEDQLMDIYAGTKLADDKRHARVGGLNNGQAIEDSGIAEFILIGESFSSADAVVNTMVPIADYISENSAMYLAFKNVNYRLDKEKWDGNRPLVFSAVWELDDEGSPFGKLDTSTMFADGANASAGRFLRVYSTRQR